MPRILIVEDDMILALVLKKNIEKLGYTVLDIYSSGYDAIQAVAQQLPDLIIMDIKLMGSIDGIQTMIEIRKFSEIPVIYVSGNSDDVVKEQAEKTESSGFMSKPIDLPNLENLIKRALKTKEKKRG
jgi:CheY-like chemotaxis protein